MQLLLAHQYLRSQHVPLADDADARAAESSPAVDPSGVEAAPSPRPPKPRSRRAMHGASPHAQGQCDGAYTPFLYSSVNHNTHRLPETLGVHYPAAPYFRGRNEFDNQLQHEATAARHREEVAQRVRNAGSARTRPDSAPILHLTRFNLSSNSSLEPSLPRVGQRSPVSSAPSVRVVASPVNLGATVRTVMTHSARSQGMRPHSAPYSDSNTTGALMPDMVPEKCMRCTVRWPACVVRDELAADKRAQFRRAVFTTSP